MMHTPVDIQTKNYHVPRVARRLAWAVALVSLIVPLAGCDTKESMLARVANASVHAGRQTTLDDLRLLVDRGIVTLEAAMNDASARLEAGQDAVAYAGAVLDLYDERQGDLPKGQEYELFWFRMGQLAYAGASRASELGRVPEARSIVLAGPSRWQNGAYWRRYPNHDALASLLMAATGEHREALRRLANRDVESPEILQAREDIRAMQRAAPNSGP